MRRLLIASILLVAGAARVSAADEPVKLARHGSEIEIVVGGKPFTAFYFGPNSPKPYLHPLRTAQGTIVTRGFPMVANIPGESHDHPHHRGLYFAHGDINGVDFWGEQVQTRKQQTTGGKYYANSEELPKGRTVFRKLEKMESGPDSATLKADFDLVGPDGKVMATETQEYVFSGDSNTRTIDCAFTITANHGPVKMGDTKEGTFAIRVAQELTGSKVQMLNSNGKVGEKEIWGKRADWVDYSGTVAGEKLGIAIFDNPQNLRHPTTWHARDYGLFAVNPFGEHDFYNDPKRDGSYTIDPGKTLTFRYRVIIHHGDAAEAHIAEAYRSYTAGK
ncbi:MAG: PmoA family protein [Deltaproteobacteria bacterium]